MRNGIEVFKKVVRDKTGLSFDNIREDLLARAIDETVRRRSLGNHAELIRLLHEDKGEFLCFVKNLTINETFFFREPRYLELFVKRLVRNVQDRKNAGDRTRILSAGCSTGEEPYSIAMSLMEEFGRVITHRFSIVGGDIDIDALATAEAGVYGGLSFRGVPPAMVERYFSLDKDGRCHVKNFVRDAVSFRQMNLGGEAADRLLGGMDIIFYRNVSIYFDAETQRRIFTNLASLLAHGGFLVMASSETFAHDVGILPMVEMDGLFLFQKAPAGGTEVSFRALRETAGRMGSVHAYGHCSVAPSSSANRKPEPAPRAATTAALERAAADASKCAGYTVEAALECARMKDYGRALEIGDRIVAADAACTGAHLVRADVLLKMGRADDAERACQAAVGSDDLCLEAYLLMGMIAKCGNDSATAVARFEKAVYIDPCCWIAHFHLAELYAADTRRAARKYEAVVRIIEREEREASGGRDLLFFPLKFSRREMLRACRMKLSRLEGGHLGA